MHHCLIYKALSTYPTVTTYVNSNPVAMNGWFNITVTVDFPIGYNDFVQAEVVPDINTSDGLPKIKICSIVVHSSGENVGCPKCMNQGKVVAYSQNSSLFTTYDSIQWSVASVLNYGLRTKSIDLPYVNQMK